VGIDETTLQKVGEAGADIGAIGLGAGQVSGEAG